MANETLRIDITANNKAAIAGLKETTAELNNVSKEATKANAALSNSAKGTNQAANALTNLGRVAQDAPFGFIGIQNNLNPLLESFQRLKAETGGTGTALKALVSGLAGPAGLGVALSVGSALLVTFGDKLFGTTKATEQTTKSSQEYTQQLKEQSNAATSAISTVGNLVAAGMSEQATLKQKIEILNQLNKISSDYFGKLKIEKDEIVGLVDAYQMYAENIYKVAKAKGAAQQVEILSKKLLESTVASKSLTDELTTFSVGKGLVGGPEQIAKSINEIDGILNKVIYGYEDVKRISELTGINESKVNRLMSERAKFKAEELRLTSQILDLSKFANQETLTNLNADKAEPKFKATELDNYLATANVVSKKGFKPVDTSLVSIPYTGNTGVKSLENLTLGNSLLMQREQLILANYNADVLFNQQQAMANELATIGTSLFTSMGNALLYGQDMGEAFTNTLKKIVMDLTAAIAKALIFKALMAAFTGGGSVVAGAFGGAGGSALGGIGASVANSQGGGGGFFGFLSGNNILMGQNRTRTSMGLKRGG